MIVSIHQPSYFPWLGLLNKIAQSDVFILLDEVQFNDNAYQHRNMFLEVSGRICYLILPVRRKDYIKKPFRDLRLADNFWQKKHYKFFLFNYKKHPYWFQIFPKIEFIFSKHYEFLLDVVWDSMKVLFDMLDIKVMIYFQSELSYNKTLKKSDLILELVSVVKGRQYLSGLGGKGYLREEDFKAQSIELKYNQFSHPCYPQLNSKEFVSGLSALDLLFNCGIENSRKIFWDIISK